MKFESSTEPFQLLSYFQPFSLSQLQRRQLRGEDAPHDLCSFETRMLRNGQLRLLGDPTIEEQWHKLPDVIADMILYGIQGDQA